MKLDRPAILVVDMLNDFVTGALACDRGKGIVPATAALLDAARKAGVPVIFFIFYSFICDLYHILL